MKKIIIALFVFIVAASFAQPALAQKKRSKGGQMADNMNKSFKRKYGMAGCGLGSMVFGQQGMVQQVLAATTNGSTFNQWFGITSGTLNCVGPNSGNAMMKMDIFIDYNKNQVASDLSRGQGETISTMAHIMGCSNKDGLGSALKSNYSSIYSQDEVQVQDITDSVITVIINDKELFNSCKNISDIG